MTKPAAACLWFGLGSVVGTFALAVFGGLIGAWLHERNITSCKRIGDSLWGWE